jgi:uncharacterized protein
MLFEPKEVDRRFYEEHLADFLPARIVDAHSHVWLKQFRVSDVVVSRGPTWPRRVAEENPIGDLLETYQFLLRDREVTPLIFGYPDRDLDLEKNNAYTAQVARERGLPALIVTSPEWSKEELERQVKGGGFLGLKPYLNMAPLHIPSADITIYDFLPHHHLEVADANGWIVVLHIPRPARLKDPINLKQLLEIEERYPHIRLSIAHIGRAYCNEDVGNAFEVLGKTERMVFDFSATTNAFVIEQALRAVGPRRLVFGSDLPISRMRTRRICDQGSYINLVPPGLYGDVGDDPHMREVSPAEAEALTFFMYEELFAFRCAAEAVSLTASDIEDVFYNNAQQLLGNVSRRAWL